MVGLLYLSSLLSVTCGRTRFTAPEDRAIPELALDINYNIGLLTGNFDLNHFLCLGPRISIKPLQGMAWQAALIPKLTST